MVFTYSAHEMLHLFGGGVIGMARTPSSCTSQHSQLDGDQIKVLQ